MNTLKEQVRFKLFRESDKNVYINGYNTFEEIEKCVKDTLEEKFSNVELKRDECKEFIQNNFDFFDEMVEEINFIVDDDEIKHVYTLSKVVNLWQFIIALQETQYVIEILYDTYRDDATIEATSESEDD